MTNIFELGRIFDPMQWQTAISMSPSTAPQAVNPTNITTSSTNDYQQGGGNTLRIGRAEHPRFAFTNMYGNSVPSIPNMGMSSAALLDLFCLTNGASVGGGPYSMGGGKINLNTAPAPVLRALAGGILLTNDPSQVPASYTCSCLPWLKPLPKGSCVFAPNTLSLLPATSLLSAPIHLGPTPPPGLPMPFLGIQI